MSKCLCVSPNKYWFYLSYKYILESEMLNYIQQTRQRQGAYLTYIDTVVFNQKSEERCLHSTPLPILNGETKVKVTENTLGYTCLGHLQPEGCYKSHDWLKSYGEQIGGLKMILLFLSPRKIIETQFQTPKNNNKLLKLIFLQIS